MLLDVITFLYTACGSEVESNRKKVTDKKYQEKSMRKESNRWFSLHAQTLNLWNSISVLHDMLFKCFTLILECVFQWYILNSNCTYAQLSFMFNVINCEGLGLELQIQTVVTDFEQAVLRAVDSKGCFYHLTQSTWRRIQHLGLVQQYNSDDEFRQFYGMLDGLLSYQQMMFQRGWRTSRTLHN